YRQQLHERILERAGSGPGGPVLDRPGGVFVRHAEQVSPEDRVLVQAVARVVLSDRRGSLAEQLRQAAPTPDRPALPLPPALAPGAAVQPVQHGAPIAPALQMANGFGGFSEDGREYVVAPPGGVPTPA